MKAETVERREVYVRCPRCGDESSHKVTGVKPSKVFGVSYCGTCGVGVECAGTQDGVEVVVTHEAEAETYMLVALLPGEKPLLLIVNAPSEVGGVRVRQVGTIRFESQREKLASVKYVVTPDSDPASGAEE